MRFALGLPTDRVDRPAEFGTGRAVMEMAAAAERARFDAVFVTEHPIPGDRWLAHGGHHALDPFVALSFAAAATTRLRLLTNLCVVPYRNPFLTAKAVASLDSLSGGRVVLGAGAGYLRPEFAALGVDFERRNELFDEALVVMKRAWAGESVEHPGERFEARGNTALPRPVQRPHPPIWIGGNSRRAIRRAVQHAQGWMPMPGPDVLARTARTARIADLADLRERLAYAREEAERVGRREPLDLMFMPVGSGRYYGQPGFDAPGLLEQVREQEKLGVTELAVGFGPAGGEPKLDSRAQFVELTGGFGADVIRALDGA